MKEFLDMGGYGAFIWTAYGVTLLVLALLVLDSVTRLRRRLTELARLDGERGVTRKRRRLVAVSVGMALLAAATGLVLNAFRDSLVFFYGPSEALAKAPSPDQRFRLGGLVEPGSLGKAGDGVTVTFKVTDGAAAIPVRFAGILPDLFREGQGVIAEGRLNQGTFEARNVLAKHDETYMPPEVVDALKKSGQWQAEKKP